MIIIGTVKRNTGTGFIRVKELGTDREFDTDRMSAKRIVGSTSGGAMICEFEIKETKHNGNKDHTKKTSSKDETKRQLLHQAA